MSATIRSWWIALRSSSLLAAASARTQSMVVSSATAPASSLNESSFGMGHPHGEARQRPLHGHASGVDTGFAERRRRLLVTRAELDLHDDGRLILLAERGQSRFVSVE